MIIFIIINFIYLILFILFNFIYLILFNSKKIDYYIVCIIDCNYKYKQ